MRQRTLEWIVYVTVLACSSSCLHRENETTGARTDKKLSRWSYIEEGNLVALVVSTRTARYRLDRSYIPLEVAVVNKGMEKLSLTPESFILGGPDGKRYPVVGRDELSKGYGNTDLDRRLTDAAPFVNQRYSSYRHVASNFTPGFDQGIAVDHIYLSRFSYLTDFLYFPRPEGVIAGQVFDLTLSAPELHDPIFVRFEIEERK